jgi:hypothetical protein
MGCMTSEVHNTTLVACSVHRNNEKDGSLDNLSLNYGLLFGRKMIGVIITPSFCYAA